MKYACQNGACSLLGLPLEYPERASGKGAAKPTCKRCGDEVTRAVTSPALSFHVLAETIKSEAKAALKEAESARGKAKETIDPQNPGHVAAVLAALAEAGAEWLAYFQQDFLDEMGRPGERAKFLTAKRPLDFGKSCVDQAFAAVNQTAVFPPGEKFIFEIPYYMKTRNFEFCNRDEKLFSAEVRNMPSVVLPKSLYFILGKNPGNPITHAMIITTGTDGVPRYTEVQANGLKSYSHYIAWRYRLDHTVHPATSKPFPTY